MGARSAFRVYGSKKLRGKAESRSVSQRSAAPSRKPEEGQFLYASERTSSTIGAFRVDTSTGKLTWIGSTPTEKQPRGFNIDASGRFMVVSGELSDTISSYAIDPQSGALKTIGRYPTGKGANWVEIVKTD
jgi:6-phosphogluconolactonase